MVAMLAMFRRGNDRSKSAYRPTKMKDKSRTLLLLGISLILFCEETASECSRLTACSCIFSNGQGYNLLPLNSSKPLTATQDNSTFHFHPCTDVPLGNVSSECHNGKGVSLCVETGTAMHNLGTAEETSLSVEADSSKPPQLILRHGNYTTRIALTCCKSCDATHLLVDSIGAERNEYHLVLVSPYACKTFMGSKGLSVGSVLLVYFFTFAGVYFIGGAIALKLLKGATGWEMVPNHQFWRDLPSLVKDGARFLFNSCRPTTYETI